MEKLFFYDLETTGVNFWKHGIHQISGMIVIDDEIKHSFNFNVRPNPKALIEDDALKVGNVTKELITTYPEMGDIYKCLLAMISRYVDRYDKHDKFHLAGYNNSSFDNQFLRAFFIQNNDLYFGSYFWSDTIDVMCLASNHLKKERCKLVNFQLKTVAKYLGIPIDETKLHDALYDIQLTYEIFKIINSK